MKVNYFKLSGSTEPAISGIKEIAQLYDFVDPENTNPARMELYQGYSGQEPLSPEKYNLDQFKLRSSANATSIITSAFLNRGGLFVSERFKLAVENGGALYKTQFFKVNLTQNKEKLAYYYMNTLRATELINFSESTFAYTSVLGDEQESEAIHVPDHETFLRLNRERLALRSGQMLSPLKIVLNENYDLLREPLGAAILISESLKRRLEEAEIGDVAIQTIGYEIHSAAS